MKGRRRLEKKKKITSARNRFPSLLYFFSSSLFHLFPIFKWIFPLPLYYAFLLSFFPRIFSIESVRSPQAQLGVHPTNPVSSYVLYIEVPLVIEYESVFRFQVLWSLI